MPADLPAAERAEEAGEGVEKAVYDAFLQWNDSVIGYGDVFRAHFCATFGDVTVPNTVFFAQIRHPIVDIDGVHLELRGVDQEARTDEFIEQLVIAQDMAHVLA